MLSLKTFKPLGRRLIVRPILRKAPEGIILRDEQVQQDDNIPAEVLVLGSGSDYPAPVGGTVLIPLMAGQEMTFDGEKLRLISEGQILAVLNG